RRFARSMKNCDHNYFARILAIEYHIGKPADDRLANIMVNSAVESGICSNTSEHVPDSCNQNQRQVRAVVVHTSRWLHRILPWLPAKSEAAGSSSQPGKCLSLHLFPGDSRAWIR